MGMQFDTGAGKALGDNDRFAGRGLIKTGGIYAIRSKAAEVFGIIPDAFIIPPRDNVFFFLHKIKKTAEPRKTTRR